MRQTREHERRRRAQDEGSSYGQEARRRPGTHGDGDSFGFGPGAGGVQWVFLVVAILLVLAGGRLVYLQVFHAQDYSEQAEQRRTNSLTLLAKRGTIYDRKGNVLAMNEDCYDVYCNPQEVNAPAAEALIIADHLGGDAKTYQQALKKEGTTFAYVSRLADKDRAEQMRDELRKQGYTGVYLLRQTKRVYPYGTLAGQVLGMVDVDGNGLTGLELYYDKVLSGTNGYMTMETGADGTPIAGAPSQTVAAKDGTDIVLTIDADIQRTAEEQVKQGVADYKAESGFCMVTDPTSGEVLAACSTPYVNLSDTSQVEEGALSLKLVTDSYEPGSIFKVITMAIGIDDGLITADSTFTVPPRVLVGSDYVQDDDARSESMSMDVREILRRSSNTGAALIAQDVIGAQRFSDGVSKFQIGQKTGIDYPGEADGLVRSVDDYEGSSLGSMSFGQGLAVPMVQMVKAIGSIANGGTLTTPHFLKTRGGEDVDWPSVGTSVSAETAAEVTDMMRTVVQSGTAEKAQVEGYDIAGKTGTAEYAENGTYVQGEFLASLVGFAPASDPKVLVYVGLNKTPNLAATSAAPVFSSIMGEALTDMGIAPTSSSDSSGSEGGGA